LYGYGKPQFLVQIHRIPGFCRIYHPQLGWMSSGAPDPWQNLKSAISKFPGRPCRI